MAIDKPLYGEATVIADDLTFKVSVLTAPPHLAGNVMIKIYDGYGVLDDGAAGRLLFALVRALPEAVKAREAKK